MKLDIGAWETEMDGDWQINMHTASEYARLFKRKLQKNCQVDRSISKKLLHVAVVRMKLDIKTFGEWDFHVFR